MKDEPSQFPETSEIDQAAADWSVRIDRGLTPEEQDRYTSWLSEDRRHLEAMALYQWGWDEFDRLAGLQTSGHARIDPDLLEPGRGFSVKRSVFWRYRALFATLPLAASIALVFALFWSSGTDSEVEDVRPSLELMTRIERRTLEDGSKLEINRGAVVEAAYTPQERRVVLESGEANFNVEKDPSRPFVVTVAGVSVRAVGTVFSVKRVDDEVEVIVTEGKVAVSSHSSGEPDVLGDESLLVLGQRAKVSLDDAEPIVEVTTLNDAEMEEANRWRPRLLDFDSTPIAKIVAEFNRCNPIQVSLEDPSIDLRLSSSFWSDNVEGFVRLMESSFGMDAEWRGAREIVLRERVAANDR